MSDPVIRPSNGVLLIGLQSAEGTPATLSPLLDAIPLEDDSVSYNTPWRTEASTEVSGSLVGGAPLVVGQPATFSFRSRLKGAGPGITYTASIKPPLHAPLQACGMRGQFTAAVSATALSAGSTTTATLASPFVATADAYRGMPLILTGGVGAGQMPLITGYTTGRVATLSDLMPGALDATSSGAIPANWTYAGTSPGDLATRATDHPCVTIYWYEDGRLYQIMDARGTVDLGGNSARPGIATFNFTGIYMGNPVDAAVPTNAVIANHSAPLLVQGTGKPPAMNANRHPLPISQWSINTGGEIESPDDPNTTFGYAGGQISTRTPIIEVDPLMTLVATRDSLAEIAAFVQYPAGFKLGNVAGNRLSVLCPLAQPIESTPGKRGTLRSETLRLQALNPGKDAYGRDGERIICFF